jgi:hypothetical protein
MAEIVEPFYILESTEFPGQPFAQLELKELRISQREDSLIKFWINAVKGSTPPLKTQSPKRQRSLRHAQERQQSEINYRCIIQRH